MKKNVIKKLVSVFAVTTVAGSLLAGCGSTGDATVNSQQQTSAETTTEERVEVTAQAENTTQGEAEATEEATGLLKDIKDRGYIIVGTEGTWSPYTFHDADDNLVGYDVEVAKYIADYIGVDIQYSETVWSSMFASLDAGQIDVVINGVSYNEERAEKYDFSIPYNYSQHAYITLAERDDLNTLEDAAGKTAANDPTSSIGKYAEDAGAVLDEVGEAAQAISEVKNGRADLSFGTVVGFEDYLNQHPEDREVLKVVVTSDPEPNAYIPVVKGNEQLVEILNEALQAAYDDGTLSELAIKYFGVDTTKG